MYLEIIICVTSNYIVSWIIVMADSIAMGRGELDQGMKIEGEGREQGWDSRFTIFYKVLRFYFAVFQGFFRFFRCF